MTDILETRGLGFLDVVRYPDMAFPAAAATFVVGDSGSGKSTLLKLINATLPPTTGTVLYDGVDIAAMDTLKLRREVMLVGQSAYLLDATIAENFAAFHEYRDCIAPDPQLMRDCLELARLDMPADTCCTTLSGGERQRVFIAVCLSFHPRVLMLDEPTSALDADNALAVLDNIKAYCQRLGVTLLAVSHDHALVDRFADHTITLERRTQAWTT